MIRSILAGWVCIFWALWLGGLGALFLIATRLFTVNHELAVRAAPVIFLVFERYQILIACGALLATAGLRITTRSIRVTVLFWFLAVAAMAAALQPMVITRRMEALRLANETSSPEFKKLHGESMVVYSGETLVLLGAGFLMPGAMRSFAMKKD